MSEDDFFLDDDAVAEPAAADAQAPWTILVVDDEPDVHDVTRVALAGVRFRGRPMRFLSCLSAAEARQTLASEPDVALILLDVVMESDTAGLDLVHWIREERGDRFVRIVLRTGQPGIAPERRVIEDYDINDYKAKSELTRDRLFTALIGSLRNYQDLQTIEAHRRVIEANRHGLLKIIDAADTIFRVQSAQAFADGVLEQLRALVCPERDVVYAHTTGFAAFSPLADLEIMAGLGSYREAIGRPLHGALEGRLVAAIEHALEQRRSVSGDDHFVGYVDSGDGRQNVLVLDGVSGPLSEDDQHLVDLYCRNVGVAFDNLMLRDEIERTQREIIYQLGEVVETRSKETGNHVRRVAEYSRVLALAMGCTAEEAEIVRLASPLHDIGKIGIPDAVLLKPGRFDPAEREIMNTHAQIGHDMLKCAQSRALKAGAVIAHEHHEKWDGSGYPRGLKGQEIHLYGRITALADVFDALGSDRVYKKAWPLPRIFDLLREERGRHFDPELIDRFFEEFDRIDAIRQRYTDVQG